MTETKQKITEQKVGVGTIIQFYDVPSTSKKAKKRWLRGMIVSKTTMEGLPIFLVVRENGITYLVMPNDVRKDNINKKFKIPPDFEKVIADEEFLKKLTLSAAALW